MLEKDNCSDESTVAAVNSTSTSAREGMFIDSTKKNYDSHLKKFCDFFMLVSTEAKGSQEIYSLMTVSGNISSFFVFRMYL